MDESPVLSNYGDPSGGVAGANATLRNAVTGLSMSNVVSQLRQAAQFSKQLLDNITRVKVVAKGGLGLDNNYRGGGGGMGIPQGNFTTPQPANSGGMGGSGLMRFGFAAGAINAALSPAINGAVDRSFGISQMALTSGQSYAAAQQQFLGIYKNAGFGLTAAQTTQATVNATRMGLQAFGDRVASNGARSYVGLAGTSALLNPYGNPEAMGQAMMSSKAFYMNRMFGTRLMDANGAPNPRALMNLVNSSGPGGINLQSLLSRVGGNRAQAASLISQEFLNPNTMGHKMLVARFGGNEDAANAFANYAAASARAGQAIDITSKAGRQQLVNAIGKNSAGALIAGQQQAQKALGAASQDALMANFATKLQLETTAMQTATAALHLFGPAVAKAAAELTALATALGPLAAQIGILGRMGGGGGGGGILGAAGRDAQKIPMKDLRAVEGAGKLALLRGGLASRAAGAGGFLLRHKGSLAAIGATMALDATGHHHLANIAGDAMTGAMIGSFIPGVGTGAGAAIGAAWGAKSDIFSAVKSIGSFFGDNLSGQPTTSNPWEDRSGGATYQDIIALSQKGPHSIVTSTVRGTHAGNSFHYTGNAVDFADKAGSHDSVGLLKINQWWAKNYGKSLSELIYAGPGATTIKDGKTVPLSFWGAPTVAEHHNHVHVAATKAGLHHGGGGVAGVPSSNQDTSTGGGGVASGSGSGGVSGSGALGSSAGMSLGLAGLSSSDIGSRLSAALMGGGGGGGGNATGTVSPTGKVGVGRANTIGSASAPNAPSNPKGNVALARSLAAKAGWTGKEWNALYAVWNQESGFNDHANNGVGYYGIPQGPIGKLRGLSAAQQINWGINYIKNRYHDPLGALAHKHATDSNLGSHALYAQPGGWYKAGAYNINRDQLAMVHKGEMILNAQDAAAVRAGGGSDHHCPPISVDLKINVTKASEQEAERLANMVVEKVREKMLIERISGR